MIGDHVYVDGDVVPRDEAKVSVFDHGFVYGDGVFEGIAVANRGIFKLEAHLSRLEDSARYLAITPALSRNDLVAAAVETARRNALDDGYLRIVLTRGAGPVGIRNIDQLGRPTLVIIAQHEAREARERIYRDGQTAMVSSLRRVPAESVDPKAKTCNYINNILAYLEAKAAGATTALMLDARGHVAETYAANIFCARGRRVMTPRLGAILNGITRQTVIELGRGLGLDMLETDLTLADLYCADEVFETGSLAEIKPVVRIGGRSIGSGRPGPVAGTLHGALRELMISGTESVRF